MTGDGSPGTGDLIDKDAVTASFAQEDAPVTIEMADQVATFHGDEAVTWTES